MARIIKVLLIFACLFAAAGSAYSAQQFAVDKKALVYIEADEMNYDGAEQLVTAAGNVQVTQGDRLIMASMLTYNEKTSLVYASGKVTVLEPDGNVYFAEKVQLKDDLANGVVRQFRARLSDGSLVAASSGVKESPTVTKLEKAVYSPCKICKDKPNSDPLWQIKASEVKIDEEKEKMSYRDAFFEVYGVPIIYTPYFSHPTPGAERKTGFLTPTWKGSSRFGAAIETPYYFNIAPNMDATLSPIITAQEGPIFEGEYRYISEKGVMKLRGSITDPQRVDDAGNKIAGHEVRGHIQGDGNFKLTDYWSWGFNGKRASDDTYLGKYGYGYEDYLTARTFVDGVASHEYFTAQAITFQGLRANSDPAATPLALPAVKYYYESNPFYNQARWYSETNILSLTRDTGPKSHRGSNRAGVKMPGITKFGLLYEVSGSVRGDYYSMDDYSYLSSSGATLSPNNAARIIPETGIKASYPLINTIGSTTLIVEPMATVYASPDNYNQDRVPNEDSQVVEFTDTNLFDANRFTGIDRYETGTRFNYGVRGNLSTSPKSQFDYLFGQSIIDSNNSVARYLSKSGGTKSDYVGMIGVNINTFNAGYRFRLDESDMALKRNELSTSIYIKPVSFGLDYDEFEDDVYLSQRKQLAAFSAISFADYWTLSASGRRDFSDTESGLIDSGINLIYKDECVTLTTGLRREFTRDRDIKPNTSFLFKVSLKNLE